MLSKVATDWEMTGLLDNLESERQEELAKLFEKIAVYLISCKKNNPGTSIIFPVLRRLFCHINKPGKFELIIDIVDLFWDLNDKYDKSGISSGSYLSLEEEFLDIYCENYVNDLKKRGII